MEAQPLGAPGQSHQSLLLITLVILVIIISIAASYWSKHHKKDQSSYESFQHTTQKPYVIPLTEPNNTTNATKALKFNTTLLPYLLNSNLVDDMQPQIIPRELKILELPFKKQITEINIKYTQPSTVGQVLKSHYYRVNFDLDQPVQQVQYNQNGKPLIPFADNVSLTEFITHSVSKADDIEAQKNQSLCDQSRRALRLIHLLENNFATFITKRNVEQDNDWQDCTFSVQINSKYLN